MSEVEQQKRIKELLIDALTIDGEHHKQWYLWRIVKVLGIDLSSEWDEEFPEPEKGSAP